MSTKQERQRVRIAARNKAVRTFFNAHQEKHPQWRYAAIVELTADTFFLSEKTIEAILSRRPPYNDCANDTENHHDQ